MASRDYSDVQCDDLWQARNQIYANAGFCFKTALAIEEFGRRCYPPYGKLNGRQQRDVRDIQRAEANNDCT